MASVVFLRAVNVGGTNRCQPALIAKQLARFQITNIGAVGTFVVRESMNETVLRAALARKLPFKCEIIICPAKQVVDLVRRDPFAKEPSGPDITRFVNVLHKPLPKHAATQLLQILTVSAAGTWLVKIVGIRGRFVLGLYRREMKAISYLGKIEKQLGVPMTTRNWNTIQKIAHTVREHSSDDL